MQLIINQNWFRQWLGAEQISSHYLSQWWSISMVHICVYWVHWVDYYTVPGKSCYRYDAEKNSTVRAHNGYLNPHIWKWAIPNRQVGSGRVTGWPYIIKFPLRELRSFPESRCATSGSLVALWVERLSDEASLVALNFSNGINKGIHKKQCSVYRSVLPHPIQLTHWTS